MAVFWVTEAVPIAATAFMPVVLFSLMGVMTAADVSKAYISVSALPSSCRLICGKCCYYQPLTVKAS